MGLGLLRCRAVADDDLVKRAREAAQLLEQLGGDLRALAQLDEDTRLRLVSAAGQLSRPDRYSRKQLGKVLARQRVAAKKQADRALLDATGIRALRREPVFRTPLPRPDQALDAPVRDDAGDADPWAEAEATRDEPAARVPSREPASGDLRTGEAVVSDGEPIDATGRTEVRRVADARLCYCCKSHFHELHHFYDQMCPPCAELNWRKRTQTADLRGRVALVTGARVKIGYQAAVLLLRAGAEVVVATRFPRDAARRFAREPDAADWAGRLHVYGIDLRHTPSVERLCEHLVHTLPRLDALINNACQTVRRAERLVRPRARPRGRAAARAGGRDPRARPRARGGRGRGRRRRADRARDARRPLAVRGAVAGPAARRGPRARRAPVPRGRLDQDLQQVDLRERNSWRYRLADVPTAELLEVHLVNAVAPFVLNARLRPLLARVPTRDAQVVNVSAMEGQFYRRWKTDKHPHTNMAKAALNMMTRTSAADYVRDGVHMNSVDTGWVTDEDPLHHAERKQRVHGFHPPLDIVDGAARIVDPVFDAVANGHLVWGLFLKDYKPAPW